MRSGHSFGSSGEEPQWPSEKPSISKCIVRFGEIVRCGKKSQILMPVYYMETFVSTLHLAHKAKSLTLRHTKGCFYPLLTGELQSGLTDTCDNATILKRGATLELVYRA
jgi:hypothetical protein